MKIDYLPHEVKHTKELLEVASECTLFLKRDNTFPIKNFKTVALFGSGARKTIKGGTGSGSLDIHHFVTIEEAFEEAGVEVVTKKWLDDYDEIQKNRKPGFYERVKKEAKEKHMQAAVYSIGAILEEGEYDLDLNYDADIVIYVLARNAGEGQDRRPIKGDFYLTDTEIRDIKFLNEHHKKFLLVLNTPSVLDISPLLEVKNILLLSQLGTVTSEILLDIIRGKRYPSGKLGTTWAKREDYPCFEEFGDRDNTNYKEGIYVGYRYFNSADIIPMFEFGYGLSYTDFDIKLVEVTNNREEISVKANVKNIGDFAGKEVVQLYLEKPCETLDNPKQILVQFAKTNEIAAGKNEDITLKFKLSDFASFDEKRNEYIIQKGMYYLSLGNSSLKNKEICSIEVDEEVVLKKVNVIDADLDFQEEEMCRKERNEKLDKNIALKAEDFDKEEIKYCKYKVDVDPFINSLKNDDLINMMIGDIKGTVQSIIGDSCSTVCGGAGESTLKVKGLTSISLVDGPAGLRITKEYICSKGRNYKLSLDPFWVDLKHYLPKIIYPIINLEKHRKRKGEVFFQYTTSIPIATALAQSFNRNVLTVCGDIVREEMELYNVDLWLAPALNIHRNPLCGRNFEYYSEDPFLSGECATAITNAVQKNPRKGVTLKHLFCNNQETNRTNSSSNLSARAFREIYLFGFAKTIKESAPAALMMSYNLINGIHTSEHYEIMNDVIRCELGYKGLIMTDWITTGTLYDKKSIYPGATASSNLKNGMNLCMPGGKTDIKDIKKALRKGELNRNDLLNNATILYQTIKKLKA